MTQSSISPNTTTAPILLRKTPRWHRLVGVSHFHSVFPFLKSTKGSEGLNIFLKKDTNSQLIEVRWRSLKILWIERKKSYTQPDIRIWEKHFPVTVNLPNGSLRTKGGLRGLGMGA